MIKHNRQQVKILNVISDALLVFVSYILAMYLRFMVMGGIVSVKPVSGKILFWIAVLSLVLPIGYYAARPRRHIDGKSFAGEYIAIAAVNGLGTLAVMAILFLFRVIDFSRISLLLFWLISSALVILKHVLGRVIITRSNALGYTKRHIIIVGDGMHALQYADDVKREGRPYIIDGYVSPAEAGEGEKKPGKYLGTYEELNNILDDMNPDEMVVALEPEEATCMPVIIAAADRAGIYVSLIPFFNEYYPAHTEIDSIGSSRLINLRATPLDSFMNAMLKRLGDIIGSILLIIISSPLMLISVIGVKLSSPGPILFKQERVGKDRNTFQMLKFRSMRVNAAEATGWSTDVDPRRTKFGSFIRKYSIDELPQFFNVLKGDMSLVGPRPEIPFYVHQFKETVPLYLVRQQVRPGITGWAQIHGLRGDTSIEERVVYDIWYIENWSPGLDIKILFSTLFGGKFKNNEQ